MPYKMLYLARRARTVPWGRVAAHLGSRMPFLPVNSRQCQEPLTGCAIPHAGRRSNTWRSSCVGRA